MEGDRIRTNTNRRQAWRRGRIRTNTISVKPVLNWANVCLPKHTSDTWMNYDSFLN